VQHRTDVAQVDEIWDERLAVGGAIADHSALVDCLSRSNRERFSEHAWALEGLWRRLLAVPWGCGPGYDLPNTVRGHLATMPSLW
jgi:hypothetical protein